jgi:hypothetical protein
MSTPRLLAFAQLELAEAIDWYGSRRPGLGVELLGAVDLALGGIAGALDQYPPWSENRRFRRIVLNRFPYLVFYQVTATGPEVVAIAHAKRRPAYWLRRIKPPRTPQ